MPEDMPEEKKFKRGYYKSEDDKEDNLLARMHNENPDQIGFIGNERKIEEQKEEKKEKIEEIILDIKYIKKAKEDLGEDASPEGIKRIAYFYYLRDRINEILKNLDEKTN
ncbi:MAG: hypothetical protein QW666_03795 [Candidatus Woesearchaeota archaeon]